MREVKHVEGVHCEPNPREVLARHRLLMLGKVIRFLRRCQAAARRVERCARTGHHDVAAARERHHPRPGSVHIRTVVMHYRLPLGANLTARLLVVKHQTGRRVRPELGHLRRAKVRVKHQLPVCTRGSPKHDRAGSRHTSQAHGGQDRRPKGVFPVSHAPPELLPDPIEPVGHSATSAACSLRCASVVAFSARSSVAARTTGGALPASRASSQRSAQRHQLSPGFSPGNP